MYFKQFENYRMPAKAVMIRKPSRISVRSNLINCVPTNNSLAGSCVIQLKNQADRQRNDFKNKFTSFKPSSSSRDYETDALIVAAIEKIVLPNLKGVRQRIEHFKTHLNSLLFYDSIPCDLLLQLFDYYFRNIDGKPKFIRPNTHAEYHPISLIILIVDIVELFLERSEVAYEPLTVSHKYYCELGTRILNYAALSASRSVFTIYSIIASMYGLFVFGAIRSAGIGIFNGYPMFENCYNIAVELKIHLDINLLDPFLIFWGNDKSGQPICSEIDKSYIKNLWNFILVSDEVYCSTELNARINFKYCHGYYWDVLKPNREFIAGHSKLSRKVPHIFYNLHKTFDLNALLQFEEEILQFLSKLPSLKDIEKIEKDKTVWFQVRCQLKLLGLYSKLV